MQQRKLDSSQNWQNKTKRFQRNNKQCEHSFVKQILCIRESSDQKNPTFKRGTACEPDDDEDGVFESI